MIMERVRVRDLEREKIGTGLWNGKREGYMCEVGGRNNCKNGPWAS